MFGIWRMSESQHPPILHNFLDETATIEGKVFSEPDIGSTKTRLKVRVEKIISEQQIAYPKENIIIYVAKYPEYQTGDRIKITGKIQKPENFDNENGIEFDYVNFLAKDRIFGLVYYGRVELLSRPNKSTISKLLFDTKTNFLKKISTILPSPESELLGGLLLGVKKSLGKEIEEEFRKTGLIHIVVLSGYNITIIIVAVFKFLGFLPRLVKYFIGVGFIVAFAIMVGLGATVVRASIMSIIVILAKISGRESNINRSLVFAALIMVMHNPLIFFYDPSFQLSFVAALGLVNLADKISGYLFFVPEKFEAREIVAATTSTQIAVLPLILKMTGDISIVALPANLIVLPLIPLTMFFGFVTGLLAYIYWPAGFVSGLIPGALLKSELAIVDYFANFKYATVSVPAPGIGLTILFYGLVIIFFYYRPIQVCKKVVDIFTFSARQIIRHK